MTASSLVLIALLQEVVCSLETGDFVAELDGDLGRVERFLVVSLLLSCEGFGDVWGVCVQGMEWRIGECAGAT